MGAEDSFKGTVLILQADGRHMAGPRLKVQGGDSVALLPPCHFLEAGLRLGLAPWFIGDCRPGLYLEACCAGQSDSGCEMNVTLSQPSSITCPEWDDASVS